MPAIESAAVLNGRYHVLRPVGRGGMGAVYEAIDLRLRNTVAVKKMTAEGAEAQRAFEREGQLLAALRHRALPVVIDYFIEDGACYLVMQFIEGEDLAALVRRSGGCAEKDVQRWAAEVLAALVYLHGLESPVVHRDIKPANIKLTPRGDVVLLDFGLAKGQASATRRVDDQSIYGFTPNYAPPEQLQFQHTDARSDLYALGATLYHLVSGAAPPSAVDRSAAMGVGRDDPLTTATSAPTVSAHFAAVLRRAMAIDPAARFASAADMLSALTSPFHADAEAGLPLALLTPSPSRHPSTRTRRLDAATPSRAELERPVDVLVQVRFADSPLLGLEDWPTRRKPDRIEQSSEPVRIEHAVDPSTGRLLPARLRIRLVAPDFDIRGASEQLIDVAPDEYSQRVAFLMTPRRLGHCRVNVEVYAADAVYLGAIGIESEIVSEGARQAPLCTADLVLDVAAARERSLAPPTVALQPAPMAEARLPTSFGGRPSIPAGASRPDAGDSAPPVPPRSSSRVRTLGIALSAVAVLMIAVQVQRSLNTTPDLATPDTVQTAPPPETKSAPTAAAGTPQAATPAPPSEAPAAPRRASGAREAEPAATPAPRPPVKASTPDTAAKGPVAAAPGSSAPSRPGVESSSHPGVSVEFVAIERLRSGVVRVRTRLVNNSAGAVRVGVDRQRTTLADRQGRSFAMVGTREVSDSAAALAPGRSLERSFDFAVPDAVAGSLVLTLAPASPYTARFPPLVVRFPSR